MFLRKYLSSTIFIISKEKYQFLGGRPMPECSMLNWLFDIVVESSGYYQTARCFLDPFNLLTVLYKLDTTT